jgi:hypothetical protein
MATLFLDFENGNDNYAGTSFAPLAQGTDGRITTATFSSAGATFPNDGSLIGQYLSIFNGSIYAVYNITAWVSSTSLTIAILTGGTALANQAVDRQYYIGGRWKNITTGATAVRTIPGDTIRMMGSPAPTSLGQNGVWTSQALQATRTLNTSTNTTPITMNLTSHGYSTGDTIVITGHATNTNANGTWEITSTGANTFTLDGSVGNGAGTGGNVRVRNNTRVKLTTAVTQNIASTGPNRTAWTSAGGANVTTALETTTGNFKEHNNSDRINIGAGFTTGLAAYWTLPSTLDLSGYQQISFWITQTLGTVGAAGAVDLRLCSDTAGVTAVNTISIPNLVIGSWRPITVDLATNLGSSIQSIALYVNTDNGAQTFLFSNIIACKASSAADSLTLTSLIGKNTTGETFWGIQSINGTRVMLDAETSATPTSVTVRGYYGTSGTVTTWKRETIKLGPTFTFGGAVQTIQESGTEASPITYSGGWDRTNMSTQNLETWLDGVNGFGNTFVFSGISFVTLSKVSVARANVALDLRTTAVYNTLSVDNVICCIAGLLNITSGAFFNTLTVGHIASGTASFASSSNTTLNVLYGIFGSSGAGISAGTSAILKVNGSGSGSLLANNASQGINFGTNSFVTANNLKMEANTSSSISSDFNSAPFGYLNNCLLGDFSEFGVGGNYITTQYASQNHDQTANNHKIFMDGGLISSATDQRNTASGISWKLQPTSSVIRTSARPVTLSLAKVACSANNLVTIKAWMRRDNSGLTMRLVCKGGQIAGVASDVTASVTTTNAWEEETITFTPTETGVVEITAEAWGGSTFSGWVDDMTISQA